MWFLRRVLTPGSSAWWAAVADYPSGAPSIVRELLRSPSVVCDAVEARQALAWARAHPYGVTSSRYRGDRRRGGRLKNRRATADASDVDQWHGIDALSR